MTNDVIIALILGITVYCVIERACTHFERMKALEKDAVDLLVKLEHE